jgi:hypothetical protein
MAIEKRRLEVKFDKDDLSFYAPFSDSECTHIFTFDVDTDSKKFIKGSEKIIEYEQSTKQMTGYLQLKFGCQFDKIDAEQKEYHTHIIKYVVQNQEIKSYLIDKIKD